MIAIRNLVFAVTTGVLLFAGCAQTEGPPSPAPFPTPEPVVWKPATPPSGKFCIENHSPWGASMAGGIYKFNSIFQHDIPAADVNSHGVDPVRKCFKRSDLSQPVSSASSIIWLDFAWNGEWMLGETPHGASAGFERVDLCPDLDFNANGTVVLRYDGKVEDAPKAINGQRKPVTGKFKCERYTHAGNLRTERYGPIPAKWEGRPQCDEQYPATSTHETAKEQMLTNRCYACPKGYKRSVFTKDSDKACAKGGIVGIGAKWSPATFKGDQCGKADRGRYNFRNGVLNQCYSCPNGWDKPNMVKTIDPNLNKKGHKGCYPPGYPWK